MDKKLESRIVRLERLVYNKITKNEILGFSKNEKEAKLAVDTLSYIDTVQPSLDRTSDHHSNKTNGGSTKFQWKFSIIRGKDGYNNAKVGILDKLLTTVAKTTKSQKPDFDSLKNSYDEYKDGEMT